MTRLGGAVALITLLDLGLPSVALATYSPPLTRVRIDDNQLSPPRTSSTQASARRPSPPTSS